MVGLCLAIIVLALRVEEDTGYVYFYLCFIALHYSNSWFIQCFSLRNNGLYRFLSSNPLTTREVN